MPLAPSPAGITVGATLVRKGQLVEAWHAKFARLRHAHGWSLTQAADQFIAASAVHTEDQAENVRRQIMRWERGSVEAPTLPTRQAIAYMFDLPLEDFWPSRPLADIAVPDRLAPDEFSDLIAALRLPRVGQAHLDQAEAEVERLCSNYASEDARALTDEVNGWLRTLNELVTNGRVNLAGHAQVIRLTGWLALLRSCLMWDQGNAASCREARVAAAGLAEDLGDPVMAAWSWEIQAWTALTLGDMPQVVAMAEAGIEVAPTAPVAAQLHAQKAKAYARMRDQHKAEVELDAVRRVLDASPTPSNVRNHFNVDPTKASFYAMDTYRVLGVNGLADGMADTVIQTSSAWDGTIVSPMRLAEAQLTKALILARVGSVDQALDRADLAFSYARQSAPSLSMVAREVAREVGQSNPAEAREWASHHHLARTLS